LNINLLLKKKIINKKKKIKNEKINENKKEKIKNKK